MGNWVLGRRGRETRPDTQINDKVARGDYWTYFHWLKEESLLSSQLSKDCLMSARQWSDPTPATDLSQIHPIRCETVPSTLSELKKQLLAEVTKMLHLSTDESFHFELLRLLGLAPYHGSDISEVLEAASKIDPGVIESFSSVFSTLAENVLARADGIDASRYPVSARDAYFAAASYFRCADFYLHGNKDDPRIGELWKKHTYAFDRAIGLLSIPGKRVTLKAEGFDVPAIFYGAEGGGKKPTLVMGQGYDGSQEEMLHFCGFAALERGCNVITYEGPGQPSVVREQGIGFIANWEKVVKPVVDYLETLPDVDMGKIGLIGLSLGGYLCVRAAAFEHRLAAVMAIDGVYDVKDAFTNVLDEKLKAAILQNGFEAVETAIQGILTNPKMPTVTKWGIEQGMWSFQTDTAAEFMNRTKEMNLRGLKENLQCPILVGLAENDLFFKGQPEQVMEEFGEKATLMKLSSKDGAGEHCHTGALKMMNGVVLDWFQARFSSS
jgi:pimeloyl-ACP methyl ester carboxylesterase